MGGSHRFQWQHGSKRQAIRKQQKNPAHGKQKNAWRPIQRKNWSSPIIKGRLDQDTNHGDSCELGDHLHLQFRDLQYKGRSRRKGQK